MVTDAGLSLFRDCEIEKRFRIIATFQWQNVGISPLSYSDFATIFPTNSVKKRGNIWLKCLIRIWSKFLFVATKVCIYDLKFAKKKRPKTLWLCGLPEFGSIVTVLNRSHLRDYRFLVNAKSKNDFAQSLLFSNKTSEYFRPAVRTSRSFFRHSRPRIVGKFG